MTHLWEVDHPYYCSESNYFSGECYTKYESWEEFFDKEDDSDLDMNLVFRWDWKDGEHEDYREEDGSPGPDRFCVYWMGQRKGLFRSTETIVNKSDEAAVRAWLLPRFAHLKKLWTPLEESI